MLTIDITNNPSGHPVTTLDSSTGRHTGPATRTRRDDVASLQPALRSEWIKLRSVRSSPMILGIVFALGILLSWILGTFVKTDPNTGAIFTVSRTFIFSTWLSTVLAVIMGALTFTSEVQHGTLAGTMAAQPARWVTVAAKAAVGAVLGLAMGVLGMIGGFIGAIAGGMSMGDTSRMAVDVAWGLVLTTLAPVFGLGVGMIIRHSSAAVTVALVWPLMIENLIRSFAPPSASRFLPFGAANGLLDIQSAGDTPATMAARFSRIEDALMFAGYSLVVVAIGTVLVRRRETH